MLREENWQRDIPTYCLRRLGIFCWFPSRGVLFVKFVFKLLWLPKCVTTFQQTNRFTKSNSPLRKNADSWMNTIGAFISCSRSAHLWRERNEASISMARWGPDCSLLPWYRANRRARSEILLPDSQFGNCLDCDFNGKKAKSFASRSLCVNSALCTIPFHPDWIAVAVKCGEVYDTELTELLRKSNLSISHPLLFGSSTPII